MTEEQKRRIEEFDIAEKILHKQIKELLERRREYINTNNLNKQVKK